MTEKILITCQLGGVSLGKWCDVQILNVLYYQYMGNVVQLCMNSWSSMIQPELDYLNCVLNCLKDRVLPFGKINASTIITLAYGRHCQSTHYAADIAVIPSWVGLEKTVSDLSGHDVDKKQKNMALSQFARRCWRTALSSNLRWPVRTARLKMSAACEKKTNPIEKRKVKRLIDRKIMRWQKTRSE